jgi:MFS family permease
MNFKSYITPRTAIMAVFAAFGAMAGAFAGSVPQLIANLSLNNATYGLGITLMTAVTVAAMGFAAILARHFSHRALLLALLPTMLAILAVLLTGKSHWMFFVIAPLYGAASGLVDVIMNAEGGAIEADLKKPVYTAFHGSVSLSIAVFAITSSLLSTTYGTWASVLAASIIVLVAAILVHLAVPDRPLATHKHVTSKQKLFSVFTLPIVLIGTAAGLIIACEITALFWSSKLLAESAPQLAAVSGLGAAFFGLCNAIVRFPGDYLRSKFSDMSLMIATILIAITGFAGLGLTESFAANVFFFAVTGMGVALLCPCLFAMAANQTPHSRAAGFAAAMLIAGIPRIAAPTVFGSIADAYSTRLAFGLCAVALMAALVAILVLRKVTKSRTIK